ncbi:MAG: hypothetical protein AAFP19_14445 [Bacteroidota bacterium]
MEKQHLFPDLSESTSRAMEEKGILLDGQKVLFDQKVALVPAALESKNKTHGSLN